MWKEGLSIVFMGYGMKGEGRRERGTERERKEMERGEEKLTFCGRNRKEGAQAGRRRKICLPRQMGKAVGRACFLNGKDRPLHL